MSREPDYVDKAWSAFSDALKQPIRDPSRPLWITLGCLAGLALVVASAPNLFLNDMALDVFIPLDGALRMSHGQWPHADFYTPIGALYYLLLGAAARITGGSALAVVWAQLIALPITVFLAWVATRDRLPTPHRVGLILFAGAATISPRTLDSESLISHLAAYNRLGWVLTCIVFMAVAIEPVRTDRRREALEAVALTACTILAFYLKVTFFVLCGAALLIGVASRPRNWRAPLAAGLGALTLLGLGTLLFETNGLYLADLQRAASSGAGHGGILRMDRFPSIFTYNRLDLVGTGFFLLWLVRSSHSEAEQAQATSWILKLGALITASLVITSQSHDAAMPILTVIAAACFAALQRRERSGERRALSVAGLISMGVICWPVALDTQTILRHAVLSRSANTVPLADIEGSPVRRIRLPAPPPGNSQAERVLDGTLAAEVYDSLIDVAWNRDNNLILQDAHRLLAAHDQLDANIASLTFSPCFPWILQSHPPRELPAWYDYRRTFDDLGTTDVAHMLAESDVVLVPHVWKIEGLWEAYGPYVETHYRIAGETPLWTLWVR